MFKVLQEKSELQKEITENKKQMRKMQQDLSYQGKKTEMEMKAAKVRLEEEFRTSLREKEAALKKQVENEISFVLSQHGDMRMQL